MSQAVDYLLGIHSGVAADLVKFCQDYYVCGFPKAI